MNSYLRKTKDKKMTHKVQTANDKKLQNSKFWKPYSLQEIITNQHLKKLPEYHCKGELYHQPVSYHYMDLHTYQIQKI